MDVQKVVDELKVKYPGKNIILNPPDSPTEIICEIEPGSLNPYKSVAIAVIDTTIKHFHRLSTEEYEVIKGELVVTKEGKTYFMGPGEKITLNPEEYHMAKGKETWVKVTSEPAWTSEDQIPVEEGTNFGNI
jgi:quercetin dioxygenase-like cupin family protein